MNNKIFTIALGAAVGACRPVVSAEGAYLGGGFGRSTIHICNDLSLSRCDDEDIGWKLYGGYGFNPYLAVEGGWIDFGSSSTSDLYSGASVGVKGLTMEGKAAYPLTDAATLFAKLGVLFWKANADGSEVGNIREDGADTLFGLGAQFSLGQGLSLRAEWQWSEFDGYDVDMLALSGVYEF